MIESNLRNKKILVVAHITEVYGPVQALVNYLVKNVDEFVSILHPFSYSLIPKSEYAVYKKGEDITIIKKRNIKFSELLSYFHHFILTFYFILKNKSKFDIYIGIDNLNAFTGILLRKLGIVDKVVFYVIDYTPKRFGNPILNFIYHSLDRFSINHSNYIWNISKRIVKLREDQGVERNRNLLVPVGIEIEKIKSVPYAKINRYNLVFVSHLTKSKGVQLVIEVMEDIVRKVPDAKLEIIGIGPYEPELKNLVITKNLSTYIRFMGQMNHKKLFEYLPTCGIALATYLDDPDSITYFADPTKPKEYLACGLPVVITKVPWIAEIIEKENMGIAVGYDKKEVVDAVIKLLMDDVFYKQCRDNAREFASNLNWEGIYKKAFDRVLSEENG